jgi:hypothetical protein
MLPNQLYLGVNPEQPDDWAAEVCPGRPQGDPHALVVIGQEEVACARDLALIWGSLQTQQPPAAQLHFRRDG